MKVKYILTSQLVKRLYVLKFIQRSWCRSTSPTILNYDNKKTIALARAQIPFMYKTY